MTSWCCDGYDNIGTGIIHVSNTLKMKDANTCDKKIGLTQVPIRENISRSERARSCNYEIIAERYFLEKGTHGALKSLQDMKKEIKLNGPTISVIFMNSYFIEECQKTTPFSQTGGICMQIDDHVNFDKEVSMHAIAVIGWNVETIVLKGKKIKVPYWEIRNSWGTNILNQGYQKIAISSHFVNYKLGDTFLRVNEHLGIDAPIKSSNCLNENGCGGMHTIGNVNTTNFYKKNKFNGINFSNPSNFMYTTFEKYKEQFNKDKTEEMFEQQQKKLEKVNQKEQKKIHLKQRETKNENQTELNFKHNEFSQTQNDDYKYEESHLCKCPEYKQTSFSFQYAILLIMCIIISVILISSFKPKIMLR